MQLDQTSITYILGLVALISVVFQIYRSFTKPQTDADKAIVSLNDRLSNLEKTMMEVKETHLRAVENDVKSLTASVNELSKTVIKLTTIIDERIPRGNSNLTPQGK